MNFLAHLLLSGPNERIQLGNFMGDGIRGKQYQNYHKDIQIGVVLHRAIDTFTDAHPVFRASKHRLSPTYNLFSGILVDMFYDHFLAVHFNEFSTVPLDLFAQQFYQNLQKHQSELNEKTLYLMPYLIEQNWLYHYQNIEQLKQILFQMERRITHPSHLHLAVHELVKDYESYQSEFLLFFKELVLYAQEKRAELILEFN